MQNILPSVSAQAESTPTVMTRGRYWAKRIADEWQQQVTSIFLTGSLLESAKADLRPGDFMKMVKTDLPFEQSTANKLMKIAACDHLRNSELIPNLPAKWAALHELALLTETQFEEAIRDGKIHPKMKMKDAKALRGKQPSARVAARVAAVTTLKDQVNKFVHEIAHLKEQLAYADQGSLFDLRKDSASDIAGVVIATVTRARAMQIAEAIKAAVKQKKTGGLDFNA